MADDFLDTILVVVPVRDEAELLHGCLEHLQRAMDQARLTRPAIRVHLCMVLDHCRDSSGAVAAAAAAGDPRITLISVDFGSVGASRRAGIADLLKTITNDADDEALLHRIWIACTDADTRVPVHWLTTSIALAESGSDAIAGTVEPDRADLDQELFAAWAREHHRHEGHKHVHGANLGVRASAYRAVGGFDPVPLHEDALLVHKLRREGFRVLSTGKLHAVTSGRARGRVSTGFAGYLRDLARAPAARAEGQST